MIFSLASFSQEKKLSYYFDFYSVQKTKDYRTGFKGKIITFLNTKDSTYNLNITEENNIKKAILFDTKNKRTVKFDVDFNFEKIEDLNKLSNSKLYTVVEYVYPKKYKKYVEDSEFEKDTITNKTIVHLTRYKNKKKKKIINEHYYFYGSNDNLNAYKNNSLKKYMLKKHKLKFTDNENVEKILCIEDGKIASENIYVENKNVDFNFAFPIDDVYPKYGSTSF